MDQVRSFNISLQNVHVSLGRSDLGIDYSSRQRQRTSNDERPSIWYLKEEVMGIIMLFFPRKNSLLALSK